MKRKSFRASRGRGKNCIQTRIIFENGTTNRLVSLIIKLNVKASALRAGGGVTEFRQGLRVENGTTNRLLSLMI